MHNTVGLVSPMNENLVFLQNLQDVYSKGMELTIIICTAEGNLLTEISWDNYAMKNIYRRYITKDYLKTFLKPIRGIHQTILMDTELGNKVIVSPIKSSGLETYFIITGFFIDEQTKEWAGNYIEDMMELPNEVVKFEVLSNSEIRQKVEHIKNMTEVITTYIQIHIENKNTKRFTKLIAENLDSINGGTSTITSILNVGTYFDDVDFIALSLKKNEDVFIVEASIGDFPDSLKAYEFEVGEGLLGYSVVTQQPQFYGNITDDARIFAFEKMNMKVISLFCFPIVKEQRVIGLLFGGSTKRQLEESVSEKLHTWASLMTTYLNARELQSKTSSQRIEIGTFKEIMKVLTTVKNLKKSLNILLDISMNFTRSDFSSIIYRSDSKSDQVEVVSRGMSEEDIHNYSRKVTGKIFTEEFEFSNLTQPVLSETPCGIQVVEFYLIFDNILYGLFSVGIHLETDQEKYHSVTSGLATAAGVVIHLLNKEMNVDQLDLMQKVTKKPMVEKPEFSSQENVKEIIPSNHRGAKKSVTRLTTDDALSALKLTRREIEVLDQVIKGCSNKEIATYLYISNHTVKNHMTNILRKLDVSDRSQAIAKIYQMGCNVTDTI